MTGISALNSGIHALYTATQQVNRSGSDIASAPIHSQQQSSTPTLDSSLVNLKQGETYAKAGVKVIQAADNTLGTLLDIKA